MIDCSYDTARRRAGAVRERLLSEERFENNLHLADYSLADIVDEFWPAAHGWQVVAIEPAYYWPLWVLEHPTEGVACSMIGTTEPSGGHGTPEAWERLSVAERARNLHTSMHTQGPTRLAILQEMAQRMVSHGFTNSEESLVAALLDSTCFDTPDVTMMRGLGAFDALDQRVNDARIHATQAAERAERIAEEKALILRAMSANP